MGDPGEAAEVRFEKDGTVSVLVGTQSNGQGHDTAYAQVTSDRLGIPLESVRIVQGDTDIALIIDHVFSGQKTPTP